MTKLFPVRHGETEWNVEGREIGQLDSALTPRGIRQAEALAQRLGALHIDALYASDLGRAMRTAEIIARECGVPVIPDAALRERHMGIFQGLTTDESRQRYPAERAAFERMDPDYVIPEGESANQRMRRAVDALTAIAERHSDQRVVVVSHSGFIRGFFEHVLTLAPDTGWRFRRDNASFNAFEHSDGKWVLETWNDVAHLAGIAGR